MFSQDLETAFGSSNAISLLALPDKSYPYTGNYDTHCDGKCNITVQGLGANWSCSDDLPSTYEITPQGLSLTSWHGDSDETTVGELPYWSFLTLLNVGFIPYKAGSNENVHYPDPFITMQLEYAISSSNETLLDPRVPYKASRAQTCHVELRYRYCTIRPAIVERQLTLTNVSRSDVNNGIELRATKILSPAYQTNPSVYINVIFSLHDVMTNSFKTSCVMKYLNGTGFLAQSDEGFMSQYWVRSPDFPLSCEITVRDPTEWLMRQLDMIILRASLSAAKNQDRSSPEYGYVLPEHLVENIKGERTIDSIKYNSDYHYMCAAILVMGVCVLCVLPTYWGFWELSRRVTLGPMEIASAFQAPALNSVAATGGEVEQILEEVGQREVRYGVVVGSGRLAMAEASETVQLRPGGQIRVAGDL